MNNDLKQYLKEQISEVDDFLDSVLPKSEDTPQKIHEAMRYSIFAGGKRIRPILCLEAFKLLSDKRISTVLPMAAGVEFIHTYSLIHDDLPCMDNDDYRRGKLTNHKVFGENIAVLAGDALLTLAFELISSAQHISADVLLKMIQELSCSAGSKGLIGGQVVDIESEGKDISEETLKYIHLNKTARLITTSIKLGGLAAGAPTDQYNALEMYAKNIGLSFQVADDILDVEGDQEKMGKTLGKDQAVDKATYPKMYGLEKAKQILDELTQEAIHALAVFGDKGEILAQIAQFIAYRDN